MQELFIWFYSNQNMLPKGVPSSATVSVTEEFFPKNPNKFKRGTWWNYSRILNPFPVEEKYRLPEELILVVKRQKKVLFDYLDYRVGIKIFSEKLLDLLIANGLNPNYDKAKLTIINTKGENIAEQPYFYVRFGSFDDKLFTYDDTLKIASKDFPDDFLYPDLKLKESSERNVFVFGNAEVDGYNCYTDTLIITRSLKKEIEKICYAPEIYTLESFPIVYNNSIIYP